MKKFITPLIFILIGLLIATTVYYYYPLRLQSASPTVPAQKQTVVYQDSVITQVIKQSLPSVVTIGINKTVNTGPTYQLNPFNPFSPLVPIPGQNQNIKQNIGSGFIVSADGLIITSKHVVADTQAKYTVLTNDEKTYPVDKIYRDPLNDLAILKINATGLQPLSLGDSSTLQLGQMVIAIGTPLGQFTNTVTSGIVSGLGRGITAGSAFSGSVEQLDNVIQTDAPINPGNSGGPLLNSDGQVIGVNTAIAQGGQDIGFALPVNSVKDLLNAFQQNGGQFQRPYLGVRYKMINQQQAILNQVPQGAYIVEVVSGSPADQAGLQAGDIITHFAGQQVTSGNQQDNQILAKLILQQKIGATVNIVIWRNGQQLTKQATLQATE